MQKISIIIPVYNVSRYLEQCIDSVISQTYENIEIILVDDGSTDDSGAICDSYAEFDERIVVIHKENGGLSDARNCGIDISTGDYCTFVDSDDFYESDKVIEQLIPSLETNPDFVMFQFKRCNEDATEVWDYYKEINEKRINEMSYSHIMRYLAFHDMFLVSACCKLVRRDIFDKNKVYFEKGLVSEDVEWFLHLVSVCTKTVFLNNSGYVYRIRQGSISHRLDEKPCIDLAQTVSIWYAYFLKVEDNDIRKGALSFLSYEYYILLAGMSLRKMNVQEQLKDIRNLYKFSKSPKTVICKILHMLLGQKITGKILSLKLR